MFFPRMMRYLGSRGAKSPHNHGSAGFFIMKGFTMGKQGCAFTPYNHFQGAWIPNCLLRYKELSPSAKLVWARLAEYAGKSGVAWPHQETMSYELGFSVSNIKRVIQELRDKKFIAIVRPNNMRSTHKGNRYIFLLHPCFGMEETEGPLLGPGHTTEGPEEVPRTLVVEKNTLSHLAKARPTESETSGKQKEHPRWIKFARQLQDTIQSRHKVNRNSELSSWAKCFRLLHTSNGVPIIDLRNTLNWYCRQYKLNDNPFLPVADSAKAFRAKYEKIENARVRMEKEERESNGERSDAGPGVSTFTSTIIETELVDDFGDEL